MATAPPALSKEVNDAVARLRDMLPTSVISQLQTYDSYGLVDLLHSQGARQAALDAMEAGKTSAGAHQPHSRVLRVYPLPQLTSTP